MSDIEISSKGVRFSAQANVVYNEDGSIDIGASVRVYERFLTRNSVAIVSNRKEAATLLNVEEESHVMDALLRYFSKPEVKFVVSGVVVGIVYNVLNKLRVGPKDEYELMEHENNIRKAADKWVKENSSNEREYSSVFYTKVGKGGGMIHRKFINRV